MLTLSRLWGPRLSWASPPNKSFKPTPLCGHIEGLIPALGTKHQTRRDSGKWYAQSMVGIAVPRRESGILSVRRPIGRAPASCRAAPPMVGPHSALAVRTPMAGTHSLLPLLRPRPVRQAHGRYATPMVAMPAHCRSAKRIPALQVQAGRAVAMRRPGRGWWEEKEDGAGFPGVPWCPTRPNKAVERTGNKLRSSLAPLVPRRSPPAFGPL
jgi:hypothetical protein